MSRKTIELPATFQFTTQYTVLFSDINAANHLGSDRVLPIANETQLRFIKSLGYEDAVMFEDAGLIMVFCETQFLSETGYAHELTIDLGIENMEGNGLDFCYRIYNNTLKKEAARVRTSMLFFDYELKKVTQVPQGFIDKVNAL